MYGWQARGTPGPTLVQRLLANTVCWFLGHRWRRTESATGSPCRCCGYNSVQLN